MVPTVRVRDPQRYVVSAASIENKARDSRVARREMSPLRQLALSAHTRQWHEVPTTADYVCVNCGRAYKWEGAPPTLAVLTALATDADDDGPDDVA